MRPGAVIAGAITALLLGVLLAAALGETGGVFVYTLDDPYIHLALAERLQHGLYGINPGEPASPASSILFPLLLVPLAGTAIGAWVPFALNVVATVGAVAAMARIWALAGAGRRGVIVLSVATALALNWLGVAFTGLEHSLHLLATLATVLGLWIALAERRVAWWLVLALIAGPALRYEGLAVSGAALVALWLDGERRAALATGAAIVAVVGGFSIFLAAQGLPPLPSSVLVKQAGGIAAQLRATLRAPSGWLLVIAAAGFAAALVAAPRKRTPAQRMALFGLLVALAHAVAGRYGWLGRYELYALTAVLAAALLAGRALLSGWFARRPLLTPAAAAAALLACGSHLAVVTALVPLASRNVFEQHLQMRRLAVDVLRAPVGAHDIGLVSLGNPHYVLDYWGLASDAMRRVRSDPDRSRDWMERAARAHEVDLAMLYARVLAAEVPPGWVALGRLRLGAPPIALEEAVTLYATRAAAVPALRAAIAAWVPGLPPGVRFEPE